MQCKPPIRFDIYNSKKELIRTQGSSSFSSLFVTLKAGTYYIKVYNYGWGEKYSSGSYEIKATYMSGGINHDSTTFEPNDTRENAFPIQPGKKISSLISNNYDTDFYKFTTTVDNGDISIYLSNTTAPIRFDIYDSKKELIRPQGNSSFSSLTENLKAGTYYIKVYDYGWDNKYTSGTYKLTAGYPSPATEGNEILLYLNNKKASINGKSKTLTVAPFTKKGITFVPLRFVSEGLGASIQRDTKKKTTTVLLNDKKSF